MIDISKGIHATLTPAWGKYKINESIKLVEEPID